MTLAASLGGCDRDEIRSYQAPKDPPRVKLTSTATREQPRKRLSMEWAVPQGWRQVPGTQAMRIATFDAGTGDNRIEIVVSAFPGQAGGLLANVNRWRGQLHLEPLNEANLHNHLTPFPDGPALGFTLDMTTEEPTTNNEPPQRIVGAIINGGDGMTWFVKAKDEPDALAPHKAAIVQFARSFRSTGQPVN